MDFSIQATTLEALRRAQADALLVVVGEGTVPDALGKALGAALAAALRDGDFEIKAGRCLYLQGIAGVEPQRVVFAAATAGDAKAFKAALLAGLALLKPGGARTLLVASALPQPLDDAAAQVLPVAVDEALYVYRHTKPSAPAAPKLQQVTACCTDA